MFFPPFILIFVVFFFFLLVFLFGLIHWGLISYAFVKIGADLMNLDKIKKLGDIKYFKKLLDVRLNPSVDNDDIDILKSNSKDALVMQMHSEVRFQ